MYTHVHKHVRLPKYTFKPNGHTTRVCVVPSTSYMCRSWWTTKRVFYFALSECTQFPIQFTRLYWCYLRLSCVVFFLFVRAWVHCAPFEDRSILMRTLPPVLSIHSGSRIIPFAHSQTLCKFSFLSPICFLSFAGRCAWKKGRAPLMLRCCAPCIIGLVLMLLTVGVRRRRALTRTRARMHRTTQAVSVGTCMLARSVSSGMLIALHAFE